MKNGTAVFQSKEEALAYAREFKVTGKIKVIACGDGYEVVLANGKHLTIDNQ